MTAQRGARRHGRSPGWPWRTLAGSLRSAAAATAEAPGRRHRRFGSPRSAPTRGSVGALVLLGMSPGSPFQVTEKKVGGYSHPTSARSCPTVSGETAKGFESGRVGPTLRLWGKRDQLTVLRVAQGRPAWLVHQSSRSLRKSLWQTRSGRAEGASTNKCRGDA